MKLILQDSQTFKKSIDAISVLINEAEFKVDDNALSLKATDPSQISMIDFELPKSAFKEYNVASASRLGMGLEYLRQVMARSKSGESLEMSLDASKSKLLVEFKASSTRKFHVPLIEITSADLPSPKLDYDALIKIKASAIQEGLKDASLVSNHITLGVKEDTFILNAASTRGDLEDEIPKKDDAIKEFTVKNVCKSMFPLDFLLNMLKGASADTEVTLELKTNAPVRISYGIGDAKISYFLAPRIEG